MGLEFLPGPVGDENETAFAAHFYFYYIPCRSALAHGDFKHVIGTVEKTSADSVTVRTASGSSVEVKLVATTTFVMRSAGVDKPAKAL